MRKLLFALLAVGLSSHVASAAPNVQERLDSCISYYEFGEYAMAADSIKALLPLISDKQMEATAYKYLGFSYVMLEMVNRAKDFFRVALEKFPQMEVDTLEVPPNIMIVFKQAKLEHKIEEGDTGVTVIKADPRVKRRRTVASVLLASGVVVGGLGGYFFFDASNEYDEYQAIDDPSQQDKMDAHYENASNSLVVGIVTGGVGVALLPVSLVLFLKKNRDKDEEEEETEEAEEEEKVSIRATPGGVRLVYRF
jgi:hypothetical protein